MSPQDFRPSSLSLPFCLPVDPQDSPNENESGANEIAGETAVVLVLAALANAIKMRRRRP